jgi:hypothetical protein
MSVLSLKIAVSKIDIALQHCDQETKLAIIDKGYRPADQQFITLHLREVPKPFVESLLKFAELSKNQARVLNQFVNLSESGTTETPRDLLISTTKQLFYTISSMGNTSKTPNCMINFAGRKFPVRLECDMMHGYNGQQQHISLHVGIKLCDFALTYLKIEMYDDFFIDENGLKFPRKLSEIFTYLGVEFLEDREDFSTDLIRARLFIRHNKGKMFTIPKGTIIVENWQNIFFKGIQQVKLDQDEKAIVEMEMELDENRYRWQDSQELPFVRIFLLRQKRYCYLHYNDLYSYKWDTESIKRLVINKEVKGLLIKLFNSQKKFTDIVKGKSQGTIILAYGSSGTGKTLTAEVFSEYMKRPLYQLEIAELGTDLTAIESNLQKIFLRVTRWNCILLFDECDIFLSERNNDLQRSALVGIFLRLLDYYDGFLFLTSNRPHVIDKAFQSRITLSIEYQDLTANVREKIYKALTRSNGMSFEEISKLNLNGRQIRYVIKLALDIYGNKFKESDLIQLANHQMIERDQ